MTLSTVTVMVTGMIMAFVSSVFVAITFVLLGGILGYTAIERHELG